jgi:MYXO-CTERM domain-containing protein
MDGSISSDTGTGEEDATADGSPNADAGVDASDSGIIEGGGCSTAGVSRGAGDGAWLAGLSILGLLGVRRNKRRAA